MAHAFISYVREDSELIDRIANALRHNGVEVWLDRDSIKPGARWKDAIRNAISVGDYFIAAFSKAWSLKERSPANEELTLAIEEIRRRPTASRWFVPILLNNGQIPDRAISATEKLSDINYIDFHNLGWDAAIERLLPAVGASSTRTLASKPADSGLYDEPHLEIGDFRRKWTPKGVLVHETAVRIVSRFMVPRFQLRARGPSVFRVTLTLNRSGVMFVYQEGRFDGGAYAGCQQAHGEYLATIFTKDERSFELTGTFG